MASISVKLKPFPVPTEVVIELPGSGLKQDGMTKLPTLKLSELDVATAEAMIEEFATAVMNAVQPPAKITK